MTDDFVWGVATSAFQIEGASSEDGRGRSIWDTFCATPGKVRGGAGGDPACDHYHLWREDLGLLEELGVDAYRFSIAWPRIVPEGTGRVNQRGLDFYERVVDGLLERGITPFATLYHWDLPQALQERGGWVNRDTVAAFVDYARAVARRLGDRLASIATLNEPWCSAYLGYETGEHAPGIRDRRAALQAAHHLLLAHGSALPALRNEAPGARMGIVLNLNPCYPASDDSRDAQAALRFDGFFNRWYLDPLLRGRYPADVWNGYGEDIPRVEAGDLEKISGPIDFLGVNYYSRAVLADEPDAPWPHARGVPGRAEVTDMGWEVYPRGLSDLLRRLREEYRTPPLYIAENGAAYPDEVVDGKVDDAERVAYLERHLTALEDARDAGADVRGYFLWSLLDNFEWALGYEKRFGIVHVDFDTQARTPKRSAYWYAHHAASRRKASGR